MDTLVPYSTTYTLALRGGCDNVLSGFRESRQESVVFRLYKDSKLRREEDEEEGA